MSRKRVISASYRCDIPAYFAKWFQARRLAGFCEQRNPYNGKIFRVSLKPDDVAAYVFWSRNYGPFLPVLRDLQAQAEVFSLQLTLTGYPRALEPHCLAAKSAIETARTLRQCFGQKVLVWRYDPVFLSTLTTAAWHRENFARLAAALKGSCDEVVFSFVQAYAKTRRRSDLAAKKGGFAWHDPDPSEMRELLQELAVIARENGMAPRLCAQEDLLAAPLQPAACVDSRRLSEIAGIGLQLPLQANRPGCLCAKVTDIGAYDLCAQGCIYCYAVGDHERALRRLNSQDPAAAGLG